MAQDYKAHVDTYISNLRAAFSGAAEEDTGPNKIHFQRMSRTFSSTIDGLRSLEPNDALAAARATTKRLLEETKAEILPGNHTAHNLLLRLRTACFTEDTKLLEVQTEGFVAASAQRAQGNARAAIAATIAGTEIQKALATLNGIFSPTPQPPAAPEKPALAPATAAARMIHVKPVVAFHPFHVMLSASGKKPDVPQNN